MRFDASVRPKSYSSKLYMDQEKLYTAL